MKTTIGYAVETVSGWEVRVGVTLAEMVSRFRNRRIARVQFNYKGLGIVENVRVLKIL